MHVGEQRLRGGNMTPVVRRGDAVHRAAGSWTPTIHRLLGHLQRSGIDSVPAAHGFDEHGREVVEYLSGDVPSDPMPTWVWRDETLRAAARLLARLHAATADYSDEGAVWQLPAHAPAEVICHNDFAPYNMVFDVDHRLVGVIDWDTASPGPRLWDLAYLAYRVVPLSAPTNPDLPRTPLAERRRRLGLLCMEYGGGQHPAAVAAAAIARLRDLADFTASQAAAGVPHVAGHVAIYRQDARWISQHLVELTTDCGPSSGVTSRRRPDPLRKAGWVTITACQMSDGG